jgi:SAM-dependent methyltransferase
MNHAMWAAPAVRRNIDQLRDDGFFVAHPSCGVEVADAPDRRGPMLGSAPPVIAVADLVDAILEHAPPSPHTESLTDWDAVYRTKPMTELPWFSETVDLDIGAALESLARPGASLLDLGTGPGTCAIAAADRGYAVVATDVSPRAIDLARARAGARPIVWVVDDVRGTAIRGAFDVVIDRGLGHVLPASEHVAYASSLADFVRPGGHLLFKCHARPLDAAAAPDVGTVPLSTEEVDVLFGSAFDVVSTERTTFPGPAGRAPPALFCVLRRRDTSCGASPATNSFEA